MKMVNVSSNWILCIIIILSQYGIQCEAKLDKIIETIEFFADYYSSSCVLLFYKNDDLSDQIIQIRDIIHSVNRELKRYTMAVMTFEAFIRAHNQRQNVTCNNSLFVVTQSDMETKNEMKAVLNTIWYLKAKWLVFIQSSIDNFFEGVKTPFDLKLVVAAIKNESCIEFYEVYRVLMDRPLRTPRLGQWSLKYGYEITTAPFFDRRHDLEGITLRTSAINSYPAYYSERQPNGGIMAKGYLPDVWNELERILNFTSKNSIYPDKPRGILEENGEWSGLIGMLQRHEIDVAISDFVVDSDRARVVDFARPLLKTSYQLYFKSTGNDLNWNGMLKPFKKNIWYTILMWIFISSAISGIWNKYAHQYRTDRVQKNEFNFINSGLFFMKALCSQGHYTVPSSFPGRLIFLSAYVVAGVLYPSYSAALIHFLTSRNEMRPFNTLQDILKPNAYKFETMPKSAAYAYFSTAKDPLLNRIYNEKLKNAAVDQLPATYEEAFIRVCEGPRIAYFGVSGNSIVHVRKINNRNGKCKIMQLKKDVNLIYATIGLTRHNPFKSIMDHYLLLLMNRGILHLMRGRNYPPDRKYMKPRGWSVIEMSDVLTVHLIFLCGLILSISVFAIEIWTKDTGIFQKKRAIQKAKLNSNIFLH